MNPTPQTEDTWSQPDRSYHIFMFITALYIVMLLLWGSYSYSFLAIVFRLDAAAAGERCSCNSGCAGRNRQGPTQVLHTLHVYINGFQIPDSKFSKLSVYLKDISLDSQ